MSNIFHKEDFSKVLAKHGMILQEHQLRQSGKKNYFFKCIMR